MKNEEMEIFLKEIRVIKIRSEYLKKFLIEKKHNIKIISKLEKRKEHTRKIKDNIKSTNTFLKIVLKNKLENKEHQGENIIEEINSKQESIITQIKLILEKDIKEISAQRRKIIEDSQLKKTIEEKLLDKIKIGQERYAIEKLIETESQQFNALVQIQNKFNEILNKELNEINNFESDNISENKITKLTALFEEEEHLINTIRHILKLLKEEYKINRKEADRINSEESKKLKELQLKNDILIYGKELGQVMKKNIDKRKVVIEYLNKQRQIRSELNVNQLIGVHITDYLPKKGIISTRGSVNSKYPRETIHFSLNNAVANHSYGEFNGKYAILIPITKIIDRIINISPMDSFLFGTLKIPEGGEILCPFDPKKDNLEILKGKIKKEIGDITIIFYDKKENLREETIPRRIKERGFTTSRIFSWGWNGLEGNAPDEIIKEYNDGWKNTHKFIEFSEKINKTIGAHCNTGWKGLEQLIFIAIDNTKKEKIDVIEEYKRITAISEIVKKVYYSFKGEEEENATKRTINHLKKLLNFYENNHKQIKEYKKSNELKIDVTREINNILNRKKDFKEIYDKENNQ